MRWTKEEKLKMVLEYKNKGVIPDVAGCTRITMAHHIATWFRVYELYGEDCAAVYIDNGEILEGSFSKKNKKSKKIHFKE